MEIITGGTKGKNIIGQRYEVISNPSQTPYGQNLVSGIPALKIDVSIESPLSSEWSGQLNQNTILLLKCLTLLNILFATSPEGLIEALDALGSMVEYYSDFRSNLQQTSLPHELGIITGSVLPSEIRPPLILDFE